MRIRYAKPDGTPVDYELGARPITIGRSPDADIVVYDDKASRVHCGIRLWDGEYYVKDLKSKNGTYVNNHTVDLQKLKPGDTIRVGSTVFTVDPDTQTGADTALREIDGEMQMGKGYTTILRQIVSDVKAPVVPPVVQATPPVVGSESEADALGGESGERPPARPGARKPIRITIRKKT